MAAPSPCPVCGAEPDQILTYDVLGGRTARLMACGTCAFCFVADPTWLRDSFTSQLNTLDVGSADRSLLVAAFVRGLLGRKRRQRWKVLDFGGGDGLLTRVLRDRGVDARWTDPFCEPAYAVGPPADEIDRFDLAVMSEVALHLTDPLATFRELLGRADRVLFTAVDPFVPFSPLGRGFLTGAINMPSFRRQRMDIAVTWRKHVWGKIRVQRTGSPFRPRIFMERRPSRK